jgi:hypothetical protein
MRADIDLRRLHVLLSSPPCGSTLRATIPSPCARSRFLVRAAASSGALEEYSSVMEDYSSALEAYSNDMEDYPSGIEYYSGGMEDYSKVMEDYLSVMKL